MKLRMRILLLSLCCMTTVLSLPTAKASSVLASSFADKLTHGQFLLQLGAFNMSNQGKPQQINIQDLIGDYFSVSSGQNQNALVGLGYFIDGQTYNRWNLLYGIDAFYLMQTTVSGKVTQEQLFTNLSYSYDVTNTPVYATVKGLYDLNDRYHVTLDLGAGPNFMKTSGFSEQSLDGGVTVGDQIFSSKNNVTFSAMAGIGVRMDHVIEQLPVECGYHLFYLGRGEFNTKTNQVLNTLKTGNSYAQSLSCGIVV